VAHRVHSPAAMHAPRRLAALVLALPAGAHADCPSDVRDRPPIGFLSLLADEMPAPGVGTPPPPFAARIAAAGGVRVEGDTSPGMASIGGELSARRGDFSACASADIVDVRTGATHMTAVGQVPFMFTPLRLGLVVDRQVRLPLASRPEFHRAPLSRIGSVFSIAFIDLGLVEGPSSLRLSLMPVRIEGGVAEQDDAAGAINGLERRSAMIQTSAVSLRARDATGQGEVNIFSFKADWNEVASAMPDTDARGFVRVSFLGLKIDHERYGWELDGGMLALAGTAECEQAKCERGWYLGSLRQSWDEISGTVRAERDGFMTEDNETAFEDRFTATAALEHGAFDASASAFVARAQRWRSGESTRRGGLHASLTHDLKHGFAAVLDGELVGVPRSEAMNGLGESGARLLVSLAWQASYQRASQGPALPGVSPAQLNRVRGSRTAER